MVLGLPSGGIYADVGDQYAFNAEKRSVSPQFSLLWLDDTLDMIAEMGLGGVVAGDDTDSELSSSVSPRDRQDSMMSHAQSARPSTIDDDHR